MEKGRFFIERTKSGLTSFWEEGGGMTNTGHSIIIAGRDGERLKPIYVKRRGSLACGRHALFVIHDGCTIICANHHRGDFQVIVYVIEKIGKLLGTDMEQAISFLAFSFLAFSFLAFYSFY